MSARFWQRWQQQDSNGALPNGTCNSWGSGSDGSNGVAQWSSAARGSVLADLSSAIAQAAALSMPQWQHWQQWRSGSHKLRGQQWQWGCNYSNGFRR
jgi:hypothetical protein